VDLSSTAGDSHNNDNDNDNDSKEGKLKEKRTASTTAITRNRNARLIGCDRRRPNLRLVLDQQPLSRHRKRV
jgi:hypothetical protein